ncbi:MAG: signal peptide peptidase SppA [Alteromonadaceae bacterium]|nr:signal peptide peptidase SppA [Alteromonadaceae bacterium]
MNEKQNSAKRFIVSIFSIVNTSRKIIINLIFFSILLIFIISLISDDNVIKVSDNSALVLNINGDVVEQKHEIDPMDAFLTEAINQRKEKPEVLLSDIIKVINNAKDDNKIKILILKLQNMNRSGLTKLRDIAKALENFKESGKQIIAIGEQFSQDQYYLASYADKIWLDPKGWFLLDGYGRYQLFYKSALKKLSISQHIFRVGTYKSAVEPYIRDNMSPEAKEANKLWLTDLWSQYKADVAKQRQFSIDNFDESVEILVAKLEQANGNIAEYALNNHWVDELKTKEDIHLAFLELLNKNDTNSENNEKRKDKFNQITFENYLSTITPAFPLNNQAADKVAIIVAKGTILNGNQKAGMIGGDSTAKLLRRARKNDKVKAVVLRVDSPGGSAYASEVIRREVELLKAAGKPVVASMGTYAASGGYWISAPADKIIASPSTITGSIGIFGFFMTFENSLSKLGIYSDGVGTTDLAGFGVTRPLTDGMAKIFQLNINRGYQDFISLVATNRNMTLEQVDAIAQGRVWSGTKAKELGLVDELGDLSDAIAAAAELAELSQYDTILIEKKRSSRDKLLRSLLGQAASLLIDPSEINTGPVENIIAKLQSEMKNINQLNDPQGVYSFCLACEQN